MIRKKNNICISNFEIAKTNEQELKTQVKFLLKILGKIKRRMLFDNLQLAENQEMLRLTRFLELMIKFVIMLDKKLELPAKFSTDMLPKQIRKSNLKLIEEGIRTLKPEFCGS